MVEPCSCYVMATMSFEPPYPPLHLHFNFMFVLCFTGGLKSWWRSTQYSWPPLFEFESRILHLSSHGTNLFNQRNHPTIVFCNINTIQVTNKVYWLKSQFINKYNHPLSRERPGGLGQFVKISAGRPKLHLSCPLTIKSASNVFLERLGDPN